MLFTLLDALGVQYVVIALYQWFDWGTDILFLDAEIYGDEFREHPSFAATRTAAIFFDVTGFIALVWALRRKAIFKLRIRKAAREGKFADGVEGPQSGFPFWVESSITLLRFEHRVLQRPVSLAARTHAQNATGPVGLGARAARRRRACGTHASPL